MTERRRWEEELLKSEERYRLLAENVQDVIWTCDLRFRFQYVSPSVQVLRGCTVDEAMSQTLDEILTPASAALARKTLAEVLASAAEDPDVLTRPVMMEVEHKCKDGSTVWTEVNASFVRGDRGSPAGILGITRDITERKKAETALKASELRYRTLMESASDAIFVADAQTGKLVDANRKAQELVGRSLEEICQMHQTDLHPADERDRYAQVFKQHAMDGSATTHNLFVVRRDGKRIPVEVSGAIVELGGKLFVQGIFRDLTERRKAERALRERDAELAHVTRLATMGEMVAEIAHELNQPLYAISNFVGACRNSLETGRNERVLEGLGEISQATARAGGIIRHLRGFVGRAEPKRRLVYIDEIIHTSLQILDFEFQKRDVSVRLEKSVEDGLLQLHVDPLQIEQVLVNLLQNACESMEGLPANDRRITVHLSATADSAEVGIEDCGVGVSEGITSKVFETYFTTKRNGMGMGLSIARRIIEHHGGRLWCTPKTAKGTIFHFTLPLSAGSDSN